MVFSYKNIGWIKNIHKKLFFSKGPHSKSQTPIQWIFLIKDKGVFSRIKKFYLALNVRKIIGSKV